MLKRTRKPIRRILTEEGLARSSNKQHSENTVKWYLCKAGNFSYSESLWTTCLGANTYISQALSYIGQLVMTSSVTYTSHKQ